MTGGASCPHRPACPGCDWFERDREEALGAKRRRVELALSRYPLLEGVEVGGTVAEGPAVEYRRRVKWVVEGRRIGLYRAGGHEVVDSPECLVAPAAVRELAEVVRGRAAEPRNGPRLAGLDVRWAPAAAAAPERLVPVLIVEAVRREDAKAHAEGLAGRLEGRAEVAGVAWSWKKPGAPATLGGWPEALRGETTIADRIGLEEALFPAGSFSQVHAEGTAAVHRALREALRRVAPGGAGLLVDLYAGTGGMGLALRDLARRVLLVEPFEPAAAAAREQAGRLGGARDVRVLAASAEAALATELGDAPRPLVVLVDPPRAGLSGEALRRIVGLGADAILYVSCDPETFARDLSVLATHGFRADPAGATPFDLMPGTSQVETAIALVRGAPPAPRVVAEGPGFRVVDSPSFVREDEASGLDCGGAFAALWLALVRGIAPETGSIPEGRYRRLEVAGGQSLLEIGSETGRGLAIRRSLSGLGHPVLGDERLGHVPSNRHLAARAGLHRPFLHTRRVEGPGGEPWESPLAPDLARVLEVLRASPAPPKPSRASRSGRGKRRGRRS